MAPIDVTARTGLGADATQSAIMAEFAPDATVKQLRAGLTGLSNYEGERPSLTVAQLAKALDMAESSAQAHVTDMVTSGALHVTFGKPRVYRLATLDERRSALEYVNTRAHLVGLGADLGIKASVWRGDTDDTRHETRVTIPGADFEALITEARAWREANGIPLRVEMPEPTKVEPADVPETPESAAG
jgi:hypothetical protein